MTHRVNPRGEDVRRFIVDNVEKHPGTISKVTADHFKITRQGVNKHLQKLTQEGALSETGNTRNRAYRLCPLLDWNAQYEIGEGLAEDIVWREAIAPQLGNVPDNVRSIWQHGFTEMFNNAIDHSAGSTINVFIKKTAATTEMVVMDNGVGIFKKIQAAMSLLDERHAILELSKGKLTTDPKNHSGEGIFFTSRMFDEFDILSGGVFFLHRFGEALDWLSDRKNPGSGTSVWMKLNNHTARTTRKIFDQFASGEDHGFHKTVVPVELARYGNEQLVSRSQAKRLLARVELFTVVMLDFTGVPSIGQAFADEIFRVFPLRHPEVELVPCHASSEVKRMINRAKSGGAADPNDPKVSPQPSSQSPDAEPSSEPQP